MNFPIILAFPNVLISKFWTFGILEHNVSAVLAVVPAACGRVYRELLRVSVQHILEVQLLDLPLQPGWKARVHGAASGQHDVPIEVSPGWRGGRGGDMVYFNCPYRYTSVENKK